MRSLSVSISLGERERQIPRSRVLKEECESFVLTAFLLDALANFPKFVLRAFLLGCHGFQSEQEQNPNTISQSLS
jgi:hypothetical protein